MIGAAWYCRIAGRSGSARSSKASPAPAWRLWRASPALAAGGRRALEFSIARQAAAPVPLSSSVIAILKVPSTITTTLAPTSSERILRGDGRRLLVAAALAVAPALDLGRRLGLGGSLGGGAGGLAHWRAAAAAACAARRAAAMKLDDADRVLAAWRRDLADGVFGSGDPLRRRSHPRGRPCARLERMIRRQIRRDRSARGRRSVRLEDFADRARARWRRLQGRLRRHGIRAARRRNAACDRSRDSAVPASAAAPIAYRAGAEL